MSKKSFSLIEIIMIIVIISIISITFYPYYKRNTLLEVANLIISDIRYTKHLAMVDNKFLPSPNMSSYDNYIQAKKDSKYWFKKRWMIQFSKLNNQNNLDLGWIYTIYSDSPTRNDNASYDKKPSEDEIAINPLNGKFLTGANENSSRYSKEYDKLLRLTELFDVQNVIIECENYENSYTTQSISFDYLGRSFCGPGYEHTLTNPYNKSFLMKRAKITLENSKKSNISICLEAQTSYAYLC